MAVAIYKTLGIVSPTDDSNAELFTVGSAITGGVVVSTLAVANTTGSAGTYRIFIRDEGAAAAQSNAIAYDVAIAASDTVALTLGLTLDAGDRIDVRTANANQLNFFAFGSEIVN